MAGKKYSRINDIIDNNERKKESQPVKENEVKEEEPVKKEEAKDTKKKER